MALGQVGARTEGDVYQGLFFWRQAADLLRPNSLVERVDLEHDNANGVDDVAVFYKDPGLNAGKQMVMVDYFQLKYHVDNRDAYSADAIIDPGFIKSKSSLLQRFYKTYEHLKSQTTNQFRLHLASNWRWNQDDVLATQIREDSGELPESFYKDGPKSDLGKVREIWRKHLNLDNQRFEDFARTLRLQLDHFGRRDFKAFVYAKLEVSGLAVPSSDRIVCPYESLIQQFLMNGTNSFDAQELRKVCEREGLFASKQSQKRPFSIGVRSYLRFAERLETEVDEIICITSNFSGRHLSPTGSWMQSARKICGFLGDKDRRSRLRSTESAIALECHGTFALLAGYELSINAGVKIAPIQKPKLEIWRPLGSIDDTMTWEEPQVVDKVANNTDVAFCLAVTHDIKADVEAFLLTSSAPQVSRIVILCPQGGPSYKSVKGADHAYHLAASLPALINRYRTNRGGLSHIFYACPNSLMFYIGQQRDALGRLALYEYDFGFERNSSYAHSITLPLPALPDTDQQKDSQ